MNKKIYLGMVEVPKMNMVGNIHYPSTNSPKDIVTAMANCLEEHPKASKWLREKIKMNDYLGIETTEKCMTNLPRSIMHMFKIRTRIDYA